MREVQGKCKKGLIFDPSRLFRCLREMLSLANGPQTLKEFDMTNLQQTWRVYWLCHSKANKQHHAFAAPSPPPRDWHGGPFPTHGELAQELSLTMRPTRTASPLSLFSSQWPETCRLSPGSCADINLHNLFKQGIPETHFRRFFVVFVSVDLGWVEIYP